MTLLCGKDIFNGNFNDYDFIVPLNYEQISYCSRKAPGSPKLICSSPETVALIDHQYDFNVWLADNGFQDNVPQLYSAAIDGHQVMAQEIRYPAILKLLNSYGGIGVRIMKNPQRLKTIDKNYIIQEYIVAPDHYVAHFLVKDGEVKWNITFVAKNQKYHIKKGAIKNYEVADVDDIELFKKIFSKLKYNGFACCDYKIKDGRVKIFEINARIGGSLLDNGKYFQEALIEIQ